MSQLRESRRSGDYKYYIDLSTPNETQMRSAVKGGDRPPMSQRTANVLALLLVVLFIAALWCLAVMFSK